MRKIGIIGLGHVGEMLANQLVMNGKVDELVLIDEKDQLAIAIQADLNDAQIGRASCSERVWLSGVAGGEK